MTSRRLELEGQLNDFNPARRRDALEALLDLVRKGDIELAAPRRAIASIAATTPAPITPG